MCLCEGCALRYLPFTLFAVISHLHVPLSVSTFVGSIACIEDTTSLPDTPMCCYYLICLHEGHYPYCYVLCTCCTLIAAVVCMPNVFVRVDVRTHLLWESMLICTDLVRVNVDISVNIPTGLAIRDIQHCI